MFNLVVAFHRFNYFLSTEGGELFRRAIEFIVFLFATYMIFSEYRRNRTRQVRYMLIAFLSLLIAKSFEIFFLALGVFSQGDYIFTSLYLPVINEALELFAIILLTNSFLYPYFEQRIRTLNRKIRIEMLLLLALSIFAQVFWIITFIHSGGQFEHEFSFFLFQLGQIVVFFLTIYYLLFDLRPYKYKYSVVLALLLYAVNPILLIWNALVFQGQNIDLALISYPFPFLSVLLFARVVFLKLSDKAYLKEQLFQTRKKYQQTKEMSTLKDEFLSMVSHELRTPLTSINLYLSLLKGSKMGRMNRRQQKAIEIVKEESGRLGNMINDILTLNKLEAHKMHLNIRKFDLHAMVNDKLYLSMAEKKQIKVLNKIPVNSMVRADEEKFKQIYVNLISNAIKFTDAGGRIILDGEIYPDAFTFSITDTGKGMTPEDLSHIFDKFYQVESILTRQLGGTGLGLSIVKQLVELHNGAIDVSSEPGKGTTFNIMMPQL